MYTQPWEIDRERVGETGEESQKRQYIHQQAPHNNEDIPPFISFMWSSAARSINMHINNFWMFLFFPDNLSFLLSISFSLLCSSLVRRFKKNLKIGLYFCQKSTNLIVSMHLFRRRWIKKQKEKKPKQIKSHRSVISNENVF